MNTKEQIEYFKRCAERNPPNVSYAEGLIIDILIAILEKIA
jgi:hypothetical protein